MSWWCCCSSSCLSPSSRTRPPFVLLLRASPSTLSSPDDVDVTVRRLYRESGIRANRRFTIREPWLEPIPSTRYSRLLRLPLCRLCSIQRTGPFSRRRPARAAARRHAGGRRRFSPAVPDRGIGGRGRVRRPAEAGDARPAGSGPGALDFSYDVGPDEAAIVSIRHPSGALTFHLPVQSTSRGGRQPNQVRFVVTVRSTDVATGHRGARHQRDQGRRDQGGQGRRRQDRQPGAAEAGGGVREEHLEPSAA